MQVAKKYIDCADKILWRIGYKNVVVGGIVGTAFLAYLLMPTTSSQGTYYGYRFFKRTKPTRYVYDHPY